MAAALRSGPSPALIYVQARGLIGAVLPLARSHARVVRRRVVDLVHQSTSRIAAHLFLRTERCGVEDGGLRVRIVLVAVAIGPAEAVFAASSVAQWRCAGARGRIVGGGGGQLISVRRRQIAAVGFR